MKKGSLFEKHVVEYLREVGFTHAERRVMGGANDKGDVGGIPNVCLEIKNRASITLGVAVAEAEKEARNAKTSWWAVIFKRRQKPTGKSYVILDLEQYAKILRILSDEGRLDS